ncbi:unnamed protein product [Candida verbasci]|uniref:NAD(P)-binding domain-containing protein n=1 Tax=Candida verbasci TaxID=1227364 RepID=A0A9W4XB01_9ASCO|nr:unnamed protein product [Candida verbasci]
MTFEKRVLVCGGAGFIGSNFLNHLVPKYPNYYFLCVDTLNYAANYENIKHLVESCKNFQFIKLDIGDPSLIEIVKEYQVNEIINFAAESCVDRSFENPYYFTKNNVLSTQNLLEVCRMLPDQISFMIHNSTDEVYGDEDGDKDENSVLNPTNPYSATKGCMDLIINSYVYSYKLPITIIRPNNIYGPLQYPEKIISRTIKCIQDGTRMPIHGDGKCKRRYLYVSDLVNAIDLIWHEDRDKVVGEIFNVGSDDEPIDNNAVVKLVNEIFNENGDAKVEHIKDRNYNDLDYSILSTKIKQLGWKQEFSLKEGLNLYKMYVEANKNK